MIAGHLNGVQSKIKEIAVICLLILTKLPKATKNSSDLENSYKILFFEMIDNILLKIKTRFQNTD